jgi:osmotically-inducible protein OsmY
LEQFLSYLEKITMGWLDRIFPGSKKAQASVAPAAASADIHPSKVGLDGQFDESGLAKRVALAFDQDSTLDDIDTLWVAQLSSKVVLKGKVPDQASLDKMVTVASGVLGCTEVDTSQVTIG